MNSPKVVVSLGLILICGFILTLPACGGGGSTPKPPVGAPTIQTVILPQGAVNLPYGVNGSGAILSATGGTTPYTWSVSSGSLPPGLALNAQHGVISGTPTTLGNYPFTVQVNDGASMSVSKALSIYIEGVVVISAKCGTSQVSNLCPSGAAGVPYTNPDGSPVTLTASGGLPPYTWCVLSGTPAVCDPTQSTLPPGLSLNTATGVISGTPTTDGTPATFTVRVMDGEATPGVPALGSSNFTITIMSVVASSLPTGYVNVPYSATLTVAGGIPNYTWCVLAGSVCDPTQAALPPGLSLDPTTCVSSKKPMCTLKGTPTKSGPYAAVLQVADGEKSPATATVNLNFTIYSGPPLLITTMSLPSGTVDIPYSATLMASGGTPPYVSWSLASGSLPPGLNLDPNTGIISGTPTSSTTSSFTVQVQDSGVPPQMATSNTLSIAISPPLTNANLTGNYAFTFNGYKNGNLVVMAGSFVANGDGTFQAVLDSKNKLCGAAEPLSFTGCLDYNDGSGEPSGNFPVPQHIVAAQSSYSIQPNGLGTMTLVTDLPATYNFSVAIRGDGSGRLIEDNVDPAERGSGAIKKQTPADFVITSLNGTFVEGFSGTDNQTPPGRYAGAGVFRILNSNGDIDCNNFGPNGCPGDQDDNGTHSSFTFLGTFSTDIDQSTGRGNFVNLTFNQDHSHVYAYAYYVVSRNQVLMVSTNAVTSGNPFPLTMWTVLRQFARPPNGFDNTMLNNTSVAEWNALDTNGAADVTAGLFVGQGVAGHNCQGQAFDPATFTFDENQGGTGISPAVFFRHLLY